jgi:hypothetical protein
MLKGRKDFLYLKGGFAPLRDPLIIFLIDVTRFRLGVSEGATPRGSALVYPLQEIKNLRDL